MVHPLHHLLGAIWFLAKFQEQRRELGAVQSQKVDKFFGVVGCHEWLKPAYLAQI